LRKDFNYLLLAKLNLHIGFGAIAMLMQEYIHVRGGIVILSISNEMDNIYFMDMI
jgi:hypothetical protein